MTRVDGTAESGRHEDQPRRQHGDRILTGREQYLDDISVPGMLHAALARSPHPHARIVSIDATAAEAIPGVEVVLTGERAAGMAKPVPHFMDPGLAGGLNTADFGVLAVGKVRWVGEPVAAVVADSLATAEAAVTAIAVEYEILPAVFEAEDAMRAEAPRLFEHWPDNVIGHLPNTEGDADAKIRDAEYRASARITSGRHQPVPMETRGYVGSWVTPDRIELWAATQNPHVLRTRLADMLGLSEERIRVIAPRMGGSFGYKFVGFPEEVLVCLLSRLTGAPVKWIETRADELLAGGREFTHDVEFGFNADGVLEGFKVRSVGNVGCLASWSGWGMAAQGCFTYPGVYKCADYAVEVIPVVTNKAPWSGFRAYGKEQANLVLDRIMDLISTKLGIDPATVRFRNFQSSEGMPGWVHNKHIDSANYAGALTKLLQFADYDGLRRRQAEARKQGRLLGVGLGYELTPEGGEMFDSLTRGHDSATVRVHPSGTVTVATGITSPGTGNDTTIAFVVAREFGIDLDRIDTIQGDTDRAPYGFGIMGGRAAMAGTAAAADAAREIRRHMITFTAAEWGCAPEQIVFGGGSVRATHDESKSMSFEELASSIYRRGSNGSSQSGITHADLEATKVAGPDNFHHEPDEQGRINFYASYPYCAAVVVVEVDGETGVVTVQECSAVDDCGAVLNSNFVDSQLYGALAQGIGGTLWEDLPYDETGISQAQSLKEYLLPRASDLPAFRVAHQETPSPFTRFGTKGAGDSGIGSGMAAVLNAVNDAIAPLGAQIHHLPLSPPRILNAIKAAGEMTHP
ncbi:xanthine dehydrogenase family protein molybdopterin-binding subunit [Amycolatopsis sp. GM8]|uniref:xanthine dehydrogenase family protein molybdopterin-binding subunit n=1 Tax=Amycolatopsis sp. GM8 TaxID=2896530 RepID=UPI001F446FDB|nr:xanthine dehydrogenase family protein molybdopterin-binding subunit [Amycolatopsis sp. GM8]